MTSINKDDDEFISSLRHHAINDDLEDSKAQLPTGLPKYEKGSDEESENSDSSSNLSYVSDNTDETNSKISYQRRALFRKSVSLQMRQIGTNVCQLLTPIISLVMIILLKGIAESNISKYIDTPIYSGLPYIFNIPLSSIGQLGVLFNITSCDMWYMYGYEKDTPQETKDYFGFNHGSPIYTPESDGMLDGDTNILQSACPAVDKASPYFDQKNDNETINEYLFRTLNFLNTQQIDFKEKDSEVPHLEYLPDAAFTIREASDEALDYNIQVNDLRYIQYHRNNGVTKLGVLNPLTGGTSYFIRTIEGQLSAADMINKAYISKQFPGTYIYSGVQIMPLSPSFDQEIMRVINLLGSALFPISL
jgi:hypothetical protein